MITVNGHDYSTYSVFFYGVGGKYLGAKHHYTRPPMATSSSEHLRNDAMKVSASVGTFTLPDENGDMKQFLAVHAVAEHAGLSVFFPMEDVRPKSYKELPDES